jgi:GTP-binding protein
VGKSSLINSLVNHKNIARTSNTPGKTRYINYYKVSVSFQNSPVLQPDVLYFVDLPGYGYAKVSQQEQQHWQKHLEEYLKERSSIRLVVQLIDSRHGPMDSDLQMLEWLRFHNHNVLVVLTKIDKLSRSKVNPQYKHTVEAIRPYTTAEVIAYSSEKHTGRESLWKILKEHLENNHAT